MLKRGQGLPLNVIVLAALAVLVLVLVIAFASGAFNRLLGSEKILEEEATPAQLTSFKLGCENACFQASQLAKNEIDWMNADYCKNKVLKTKDHTYYCWSENVTVSCSKNFETPTGGTKECSGGAPTETSCICR